jgi:hypothetical protein
MHQGAAMAPARLGAGGSEHGGGYRQAVGGPRGLLRPRGRRQPRRVPVRPRRVTRPLARPRRSSAGPGGRRQHRGVRADVPRPPPRHRPVPRPPARRTRRAGVRSGGAADQERLAPVRPGRRQGRRAGVGGPPPGDCRGRVLSRGPCRCAARPRRSRACGRQRAVGGGVRPSDVAGGRPAAAYACDCGEPGAGAGWSLDRVGWSRPVPPPAGGRRDLPRHLPTRLDQVAGDRLERAGSVGQPRAGRHARRPPEGVLQAGGCHRRPGRAPPGRGQGAHAQAGQVGGPCDPAGQAAGGPGGLGGAVAHRGGRAWGRRAGVAARGPGARPAAT